MTEGPPLEALLHGYRLAQIVHVFAKLGVADVLAEAEARSAEEIAREVGADPRALRRLLLALGGTALVQQSEDGRFSLGPDGRRLRTDAPESLRSAAIMHGEAWWWGAWGGLYDAVRTGTTAFDTVHAEGLFEFLARSEQAGAMFHDSMRAMTARSARVIADVISVKEQDTVCDIGGGRGTLLGAILERHPTARGILFDQTCDDLVHAIQEAVTEGRCRVATGNFFEEVPSDADVYVLKDILHDWDDEPARAILARIRAAASPSSRLMIVERPLPDTATWSPTHLVDITMLVMTGGRERTAPEYRALLESAGFFVTRSIRVDDVTTIAEATPQPVLPSDGR